jgi:hypothetical protein
METIMDETIERKKEMALEIVRVVFDKPYQFLFINMDTQKMYKNFDELIFSEDGENLNPPLCI